MIQNILIEKRNSALRNLSLEMLNNIPVQLMVSSTCGHLIISVTKCRNVTLAFTDVIRIDFLDKYVTPSC